MTRWATLLPALRLLPALGLLFLLISCQVSKPGGMESTIMKDIKQKMTIGGKNDKNPVAATPANIKEGGGHFQHHCQICHGLDGHATGVPFAEQMSPPVPDLNEKDIQGYTDGQLHWIINNGIAPSGMPAWKGILDDDEMWKAVLYIRNLPAKGSLGDPAVFKEAEESHEQMMEHMNMKGMKMPSSAGKTHTHKH